MHAWARPQVKNVVRAPHRLGVVLDHDYGVAEIPEPEQRVQQPLVIPLVQADGRLIQDVQHADQAGPDLRGQADALAFPAGERGRGPIQRQVVQANVDEEAQPLADLLQDAMRDELFALGELQPTEELGSVTDREARDRCDGLPVDQDREAFGLQPVTLADWAQRQGLEIVFFIFIVFAEHRAAPGRLVAQAVAGGARSVRAVEGEETRGELRVAEPAADAGQLLAVNQVFLSVEVNDHQAMGLLQRNLQRVRQPLHRRVVVLEHHAVHHDLDGVLLLLVQRDLLGQVVRLAVDPCPDEPRPARILKFLFVLALAVPDDGCHHGELRALRQRHEGIHHLLDCLSSDRIAALRAVRAADPREEQAEVVVDLGDGSDGGAGIARRGLLLDGDGRRESLDRIHVRLVHLFKELASVGREGLHVAALALGVDRVERQRRLTGAGEAGDDDQFVTREREVQVLEVVLPRALDDDRARIRHSRHSNRRITPRQGPLSGSCHLRLWGPVGELPR